MVDRHKRQNIFLSSFSAIKRAVLLVAMVTALPNVPSVAAPDIADTPCDPKYYDSLEARAWLEAEREITQNQNLIYKPDSVLEYTCFDQFLTILKGASSSMFSDNPARWGKAEGDLDDAIEDLVEGALDSYLENNFDHSYLGGRQGGISAPGGAYTCDIMQKVWMKAKCMDFIPKNNDGFFTFEEYASANADKRKFPDECPWPGDIKQRWEDEIEIANNDIDNGWKEDNIITFFENLHPENCGDLTPIKTGIKVRRAQAPQEYNEKVCIAPGCYFKPGEGCTDDLN